MASSFASKPKGWGNNKANNWVLDGDIFSKDSPKAYAPLGYGTLTEPSVVRPEDFKNDMQLPSYETRHPLRVSKPLGATFVDTESEKPDDSRLSRRPVLRDDSASASSKSDPISRVVREMRARRTTLMLGKTVLTEESSLATNRVYLDKILKRKGGSGDDDDDGNGDTDGDKKKARLGPRGSSSGDEREDGDRGSFGATGADSSSRGSSNTRYNYDDNNNNSNGSNSNNGPKSRGQGENNGTDETSAKTNSLNRIAMDKNNNQVKVKSEDEDDFYGSGEHTVAAETVLRMVDQSLVETPEKARK